MQAALRRKLNEHIEFAAAGHPGRFDPLDLAKQVLPMLSFPDQSAIVMDALVTAAQGWVKDRIENAKPDQLTFPEFPHVPAIIRVGRRQAIGIENATAKEVDQYFHKLKTSVKAQEQALEQTVEQVREQLIAALAAAKQELAEAAKLRMRIKRAARTNPAITVGQLLQRQIERKKATQ